MGFFNSVQLPYRQTILQHIVHDVGCRKRGSVEQVTAKYTVFSRKLAIETRGQEVLFNCLAPCKTEEPRVPVSPWGQPAIWQRIQRKILLGRGIHHHRIGGASRRITW